MKTKISGLISLLMVVTLSVFAGSITEKFKVYGNCGMCESRIEKAAESVDGVQSADWDKESKMLTFKYDSDKVSLNDIHRSIAKAGHDTEMERAENSVYSQLPGCCQYERTVINDTINKHKNHSH